ncbi:hypothetical protein [Aestuariispira insulae]|uniref:Uncharacterized protein n=1 Tax=Aestuariispira insulae TaxID=1461337 RepID=A0A3D9HI06_9PROT|nr:hypothetical protein [Aestuariispira insulae]RED49055.1 hypothetical protein DFP90_10632 [Aestuariispira insulae]
MVTKLLEDPVGFFEDHGGVHSASITAFAWEPGQARLKISLDDLDSDFIGIPGYAGERPVDLVFEEVSGLECDREDFRDLVVHDLEIIPGRKQFALHMVCEPDGHLRWHCRRVSLAE